MKIIASTGIFAACFGIALNLLAGSWDTSFPPLPTQPENSGISAMTYLNGKLYVAVNCNPNPDTYGATIWVFNGTSWAPVVNGTLMGQIYALSGVRLGSVDRIFVGGWFSAVGNVPVAASNVAILNPSPVNNPTWAALGGGSVAGTDSGVLALSAMVWTDPSPPPPPPPQAANFLATSSGPLLPSPTNQHIVVYIGGIFSGGGGVTSVGIVQWQGFGNASYQWKTLAGGVDPSNPYVPHFVYAIAVDSTSNPDGSTSLRAVYPTGAFAKTANGFTGYNISKWNGSTWINLGYGLSRMTWDNNCGPLCYQYPDHDRGMAATVAAGTLWVGGCFRAVTSKTGTISYCTTPDPSGPCGVDLWPLAAASCAGDLLSSGCGLASAQDPAGIQAMLTFNGVPYVGGALQTTDGSYTPFWAAKISSGVLQPLTSGGPAEDVRAMASSPTSIYFSTLLNVYRYSP
jgi:hypothetical protein